MIYTLIAYGPNSVAVPCRLFQTHEHAQLFINEIADRHPGPISLTTKGFKVDPDHEDAGPLYEELFTKYYGGCGGAYAFEVEPVAFNKAFVGFDLD